LLTSLTPSILPLTASNAACPHPTKLKYNIV
jgi:hypothetical protein